LEKWFKKSDPGSSVSYTYTWIDRIEDGDRNGGKKFFLKAQRVTADGKVGLEHPTGSLVAEADLRESPRGPGKHVSVAVGGRALDCVTFEVAVERSGSELFRRAISISAQVPIRGVVRAVADLDSAFSMELLDWGEAGGRERPMIPPSYQVVSASISCLAKPDVTLESLKRILDHAKPFLRPDGLRDDWQYAPWCSGKIRTSAGELGFMLFLGGRGKIMCADGTDLWFTFDPEEKVLP
jgi:hypothetical protein